MKIYYFNPSRLRLGSFLSRAASKSSDASKVLDAGAGEGYYRKLFKQGSYWAVDFGKVKKAYGKIDVISNLAPLALKSGYFDIVICSQVLEHVPDPKMVLSELNRVMKPASELWISVPFYFPEHELPFDFFRYTQAGIASLLESTGFNIEEIEWLEGYHGTVSYQLYLACKELPFYPWDYPKQYVGWLVLLPMIVIKPTLLLLSYFFACLEVWSGKYVKGGHCKNYSILAVKK